VKKGYPFLIMNPNYNNDPISGQKIPLNGTMSAHANHVWKNYVEKAGFKKLLVIAHSAGGYCLESIQLNFSDTFYHQVKKIAITDSSVISKQNLTSRQVDFMRENAVHYVRSSEPLGHPHTRRRLVNETCPVVSAGHIKHEYTTGCSWPLIEN
jgi:hypothetical protein